MSSPTPYRNEIRPGPAAKPASTPAGPGHPTPFRALETHIMSTPSTAAPDLAATRSGHRRRVRGSGQQPSVAPVLPCHGGAVPVTLLDILARFGWPTLARFAALVVLFLVVHAARWPFLAVLWLLTVLLRVIDQSVTTRLTGTVPPSTSRRRAAA
jgi:hypothetical protein